MPTPAGRHRFTVLGAVDARTKEISTVVNAHTVTAETGCQLFVKRAAPVPEGPIPVVLDNARYQKCALVQLCADALGIELLDLLSASPQLNRIERLGRFVRKECVYAHSYATYAEFRAALETCLETAHRTHRIELETLLAWNFQTFQDV